jgi:hypothetical protein
LKPSFEAKGKITGRDTDIIGSAKEVVKEVSVQPVQSSQNVVTLEDAKLMRDQAVDYALEKYSKMQAATPVVASVPVKKEDDDSIGLSSKVVRQLQDTVGVFNALKEFASNPLQKAIENKIGGAAAQMVEKVFTPQQQPQNLDIIDRILNSQMGAGLGAGLGQRGPELADKIISLFGKEKTEKWIDSSITSRGSGGSGGSGGIGISGVSLSGQQGSGGQEKSETDLILELDVNNPEHISAYAKSQGGISYDVARKMLMVHQDDFIKQLHDSGDGNSVERANNIMLKRNQQLMQEQETIQRQENVDYENVQEYRQPQPSKKQNIDQLESDAIISDDLRKSQVEPDALERNENVVFEMEEVQKKQDFVEEQQPEIDINAYLKSLTEMVSGLSENVRLQNETISELKNKLYSVKENDIENDIENVKKKMEKADEEIFTGVRKTKNIKIGNVKEI